MREPCARLRDPQFESRRAGASVHRAEPYGRHARPDRLGECRGLDQNSRVYRSDLSRAAHARARRARKAEAWLDALEERAPTEGFWVGPNATFADVGLFGHLH